jgi:hypothetical protein
MLLDGIRSGSYDRNDAEGFLRFVDGDLMSPGEFLSISVRMPSTESRSSLTMNQGDVTEEVFVYSGDEVEVQYMTEEVISEPIYEVVRTEQIIESQSYVHSESAAVHLSGLFYKLQFASAR